jgi:hypothetical protein
MTNPARSDDPSSAASPGYIFGVSEPAVGRDPGVVPSAAMRVRPSAVAAVRRSRAARRGAARRPTRPRWTRHGSQAASRPGATSTLPAWVIRRFLDPKAEFVLVTDPPQILAGRRLRHARRRA